MSTTEQTHKTASYDVVISGGGVVGCLAAVALAQHGHLKIALIEAGNQAPKTEITHAGFDARVIALAQRSLDLLAQCGVQVSEFAGQDIQHIHVSDRSHIGQVQLNSLDHGVHRLGRVVAISELGEYLLAKVKALPNVDYYFPTHIKRAYQHNDYVELSLAQQQNNTKQTLQAKLLLISDGGNSSTRELLNFTTKQQDYAQSAVVANVQMQMPHNNTAFERFTSQGPIALLPMDCASAKNNTMSLVWCMKSEKVADVMALGDADFMQQLQVLFGYKLGRIKACSERFTYPLSLNYVPNFVSHRAICIGNAAQTLHPIAGQGFNLGVRDVFDLSRSITAHSDLGCYQSIRAYKTLRKTDKNATIEATNALVTIFSNQYLPMVVGRNLGLLGMNNITAAKNAFAHFAMGNRA